MGCLHSKRETSDLHPNIFRVINIDESGLDLWSGQLEVSEADIILYREGREATVWPLHSLRRYGFEGEIFSFESGRRCETGEGIYAFKCRRAALLFRTLQQQIQLRNVIHDAVHNAPALTPSPQGRQALQANVVHRSSIDNGPHDGLGPIYNNNLQNGVSRVVTDAPRSPSSADILEVMPLYPRPQNSTSHVTNVYQLRELKREHNNNQSDIGSNCRHMYSNDLSKDLAALRSALKKESEESNMRDFLEEQEILENKLVNQVTDENNLSPTLSTNSEHYAQLTLDEQETTRLYVNIKNLPKSDRCKNENSPSTPLTPKSVEYCNLSVGSRPDINTYANLSLGEMAEIVKNSKQKTKVSDKNQISVSGKFAYFMSPVEELEVNYAILDMEEKREAIKNIKDLTVASSESLSYSSRSENTTSSSSKPRRSLVSQTSIEKPPTSVALAADSSPPGNIGYTTIDFDKTVALTSVATYAESIEGPRNARPMCSSPSSSDKSKIFN